MSQLLWGGKGYERVEAKPGRRLGTLSSALSQMVQDCKMAHISFPKR